MKQHGKTLKKLGGALLACLMFCGLVVGTFRLVFINCIIPTGSMAPAIHPGDRLLGLRLAYDGQDNRPQRGDIVTFTLEGDEALYAKRIIGLPGETVQIINGTTYIDGTPLDEPYLAEAPEMGNLGPWDVPPKHYFVMGDNRNHSLDSRFWYPAFLPEGQITSKLIVCYNSTEKGWGLHWT